jgi:histidinol-phosphate aminotransferase
MSKYWSDLAHRLDPYTPGEQPREMDLIKLNTNENPYPPSPKVSAVFSQDNIDALRLYPDPESSALKQSIAKLYGLEQGQVFVGNSSDEVLATAFQAFFAGDKLLLMPDITYSFYTVYCGLYDIDSCEIPLEDDFSINLQQYCTEAMQDNGGVVFANPNAPSSLALSLADIEQLLRINTESVVLIDEAYVDFGAESAASLINQYPNLLVVQTLSKSRSLAGLRVGFALGSKELITGLNRVKNSFNPFPLGRIAEMAAKEAIDDVDYLNECCDKIIATREWATAELTALGFEVLASKTNFLMAKPSRIGAEELFTKLREEKILVRYFNKPRISDYLRISIGTQQEMQAFVAAVKKILG